MPGPVVIRPEHHPTDAAPLSNGEFARLMEPLGPFERSPHLAVAVSGGPDSLALCLLSDAWARARGGRITAMTVDHRLRPESGAEARQVGRWLAERGISHVILRRSGPRPSSGVQAAARAARMRLLARACQRARVLHVLSGHQAEDQAETVLQRLVAGSGIDGLAAMPAVREIRCEEGGVRLLRPLIGVPRARLQASLVRMRQAWIDDPSNRDAAYGRTRLGAALESLGPEGLSVERLGRTASRAGRDRAALEAACSAHLASCATPDPAGFLWLHRERWMSAPEAVGLRALARVVIAIGGGAYGPRAERLERLYAGLSGPAPKASTLGGCRIVPRGGRILFCREPAAASEELALTIGKPTLWDGRFVVGWKASRKPRNPLTVRRLGRAGLAELRERVGESGLDARIGRIPAPARAALPAFCDLDGLYAVPHLGFMRSERVGDRVCHAAFRPRNPLAPTAFEAPIE